MLRPTQNTPNSWNLSCPRQATVQPLAVQMLKAVQELHDLRLDFRDLCFGGPGVPGEAPLLRWLP